ncbi:MAG: FadR family transcriptional regulator [Alphaproteobacteria bacterium]|nr:FadR family transcriptional regulator [Alphaproteobacteria bacterium]
MTRRVIGRAEGPGKLATLQPLPPSRNLADTVAARIAADIVGRRLPPGARLPTEQEMMAALGVSRTVVREAVAALKADGLVTTRQGSGAFVATDLAARPFRIDADRSMQLADVVDVMELRTAIEIEAAALAARRATARHLGAVGEALERIDAALQRSEGAVAEDFAFHHAIAAATGNAQYPRFLEFLGHHVIPRQRVRLTVGTAEQQRAYLAGIQDEHRRIFAAIRARDADAARAAMRAHLERSLERYRSLMRRRGRAALATPRGGSR